MTEREKIWQGIGAAILSMILAGIGHLYLGVHTRGCVLLACSAGFYLVAQYYWPPAEMLYVQFAIVSAADAFSFAKRGHGLF